jgi:hypothetical protein
VTRRWQQQQQQQNAQPSRWQAPTCGTVARMHECMHVQQPACSTTKSTLFTLPNATRSLVIQKLETAPGVKTTTARTVLPKWLTPTHNTCCAARPPRQNSTQNMLSSRQHYPAAPPNSHKPRRLPLLIATTTRKAASNTSSAIPSKSNNQLQPQGGGHAILSPTNHSKQQEELYSQSSQTLPYSNCCSADAQARKPAAPTR